jgi:hypothetical protein
MSYLLFAIPVPETWQSNVSIFSQKFLGKSKNGVVTMTWLTFTKLNNDIIFSESLTTPQHQRQQHDANGAHLKQGNTRCSD